MTSILVNHFFKTFISSICALSSVASLSCASPFVRPAQMENVWWIYLFINIMSFHRLHYPFRLNWLQFSFRASFGSGNLPRPHIHSLDWDKRRIYSVFLLLPSPSSCDFFSPRRSFPSLFLCVINTAVGRTGHYGFPVGPVPWAFQAGSGWVSPACFITAQHWAIHKSLSKHLPAPMGCVMGSNRTGFPLLFITACLLRLRETAN